MKRKNDALVRLLAFGLLLSTMLLGAGCSGGSDSDGPERSNNTPGAPDPGPGAPDPGNISLSCNRRSSEVRVSLSQPYEYEIRLYEPDGSNRRISWGGSITSHTIDFPIADLGFGNKTFRAVWTYIGSSNNPAFGRQTERQCSVYIPQAALEQPELYCEYSSGLHLVTLTVSFGDYDGPFYVDLFSAATFGVIQEVNLVSPMSVSSHGQQFTHTPGLSGRYRYSLKDVSGREVDNCQVNVGRGAPIHEICCEFQEIWGLDANNRRTINHFYLTYILPVHIAANTCGQGTVYHVPGERSYSRWSFASCVACSQEGPAVALVRGSSVRTVACRDVVTYLDQGWAPTFTDYWNPIHVYD